MGELKQPSNKIIHAWALEKDLDTSKIKSNTFTLEWPKNSGTVKEYPEIDKGEWFNIGCARKKILKGQAKFLDILIERINYIPRPEDMEIISDSKQESLF